MCVPLKAVVIVHSNDAHNVAADHLMNGDRSAVALNGSNWRSIALAIDSGIIGLERRDNGKED